MPLAPRNAIAKRRHTPADFVGCVGTTPTHSTVPAVRIVSGVNNEVGPICFTVARLAPAMACTAPAVLAGPLVMGDDSAPAMAPARMVIGDHTVGVDDVVGVATDIALAPAVAAGSENIVASTSTASAHLPTSEVPIAVVAPLVMHRHTGNVLSPPAGDRHAGFSRGCPASPTALRRPSGGPMVHPVSNRGGPPLAKMFFTLHIPSSLLVAQKNSYSTRTPSEGLPRPMPLLPRLPVPRRMMPFNPLWLQGQRRGLLKIPPRRLRVHRRLPHSLRRVMPRYFPSVRKPSSGPLLVPPTCLKVLRTVPRLRLRQVLPWPVHNSLPFHLSRIFVGPSSY